MRSAFRNVSQMTTQTAHPSQRPGDLEDQSPGAQDRPRHWPGQRFARRTRRDPSKNIALVSSQPLPPEQSRNVSGLLRGQLSTTVGGGSGSGSWRGAAALSMLDRFFLLPPELQLQILSYLDFGDVERFRRTCRLLRSRISKPLLRSLFPNLPAALLATCYLCLRSDDSRQGLVRGELSDARYPLASRCFGCIAQRDGFMVGRRYQLGNDATAWVCRWCGYPVAADGAWNQPEFHKLCYRRYGLILMIYVGAGCAQWCVVVVGAALCWAFFQHNLLVVPPTIVSSGYYDVESKIRVLTKSLGQFLHGHMGFDPLDNAWADSKDIPLGPAARMRHRWSLGSSHHCCFRHHPGDTTEAAAYIHHGNSGLHRHERVSEPLRMTTPQILTLHPGYAGSSTSWATWSSCSSTSSGGGTSPKCPLRSARCTRPSLGYCSGRIRRAWSRNTRPSGGSRDGRSRAGRSWSDLERGSGGGASRAMGGNGIFMFLKYCMAMGSVAYKGSTRL